MPSAAAWKKAAKRYHKRYHNERDNRWREHEAIRRAGVSVGLARKVFDGDRGDRIIVFTESTE